MSELMLLLANRLALQIPTPVMLCRTVDSWVLQPQASSESRTEMPMAQMGIWRPQRGEMGWNMDFWLLVPIPDDVSQPQPIKAHEGLGQQKMHWPRDSGSGTMPGAHRCTASSNCLKGTMSFPGQRGEQSYCRCPRDGSLTK